VKTARAIRRNCSPQWIVQCADLPTVARPDSGLAGPFPAFCGAG
jgi:hypothetical protein